MKQAYQTKTPAPSSSAFEKLAILTGRSFSVPYVILYSRPLVILSWISL